MELRTDLAVEAREIAGEDVGGVDFVQYSENGLDISRLEVKTRKAQQQLGPRRKGGEVPRGAYHA